MLNRYLLAERRLAGEGAEFSDDDLEDKKKDFLETLCEQLPIEKVLASKVQFIFDVKGD